MLAGTCLGGVNIRRGKIEIYLYMNQFRIERTGFGNLHVLFSKTFNMKFNGFFYIYFGLLNGISAGITTRKIRNPSPNCAIGRFFENN